MKNYASLVASILEKSILDLTDAKTAVSFSGGLDSTLICHVASKKNPVGMICIGLEDSKDLLFSKEISKEIPSPYFPVVLTKEMVLDAFSILDKILGVNDPLKIELMIPVYFVAKTASENGYTSVMFGAGAEELFVGYKRYYQFPVEQLDEILKADYKKLPTHELFWAKKICDHFNLIPKAPFCTPELEEAAFSIPLSIRLNDPELKKHILREAAKILKVPKIAVERKKLAMQYGSGLHKMLAPYLKENY
jgi:asparagine synthase (glutamine-hydrolysing)